MKVISEKEFLELIKNAINCVVKKNVVRYKLPNGDYAIKVCGVLNCYYRRKGEVKNDKRRIS